MSKFLDHLFRLEDINGADRCPTEFYRWTLFSCPWFKIYLHHFVGDAWTLDPHDHPKNFLSIGLWGGYWEYIYDAKGELAGIFLWKAPWIRRFPATHSHRTEVDSTGGAWTICIVGREVRPWGFWWKRRRDEPRCWVRWDRYLYIAGDDRKAC